jgi:hypothetical protein
MRRRKKTQKRQSLTALKEEGAENVRMNLKKLLEQRILLQKGAEVVPLDP